MDRLSPQDLSNLRVEARGLAMHVAALAVLEGAPLCDPHGELRLGVVRAEIERRLHLAPRLRQVLHRPPLGLGRPFWVDDPGFDIAEHIRTCSVPPPGDEQALLETCVRLNEARLDRSRPPWEAWFLTGLSGGEVGMLIRLHHVVADGIASVALLGTLFDAAAEVPVPIVQPWNPRPLPDRWDVIVDTSTRSGAALVRLGSGLAHPSRGFRRLGAAALALKEVFDEGLASRSSLNVPAGKRRRLLLARADLERTRAVAHAHGAKINDVVLAAIAGGVRELLRSRGELAPGLDLRASVPVSFRSSGDRASQGNLTTVMIVPLQVGEADPVRRLGEIARETARRKRQPHVLGPLPGALLVQRAFTSLMRRQRMVNVFTSNVPGPPKPMFFAGARVLEVFQIGVIQGNVTLSVGVFSYAGQLNFDIVADSDALPDLAAFSEGLTAELERWDLAPGRRDEDLRSVDIEGRHTRRHTKSEPP